MKINIVSVGKTKESYYREAIAEYVKRLGAYATVTQLSVDELTVVDNLEREGDKLLPKLDGYVFVLDRQGDSLSSIQLAERLKKVMMTSSTMTFVIGSTKGLCERVKKRADCMLSFGALTLPHALAKVVLTEQLYRAFTIMNNGKYHQ